jgi:hypothetical protein
MMAVEATGGRLAMSEEEARREIVRIEARIEQLAETIERCRKLILISKLAIVGGGWRPWRCCSVRSVPIRP